MLVITAILAGGVYPWVIQQFQVRPSENTLEKEFIDRNIKMTRAAYGLDKIDVSAYNATTTATTGAWRRTRRLPPIFASLTRTSFPRRSLSLSSTARTTSSRKR